MKNTERVVFLDYLRVIASFMVMLVHSCEPFYFDASGNFTLASASDAVWVTAIDSLVRSCVPLFVMASAYLLFPVSQPTSAFFKRRFARVLVPFVLWCCVYNWLYDGSWGQLAFNFPMFTGGHLWFVPMLCGLYLLMPLLSPWAEKASEKEVRGWLLLWLVTTTFPYLRKLWGALWGDPCFGAVPYLYGECPWNAFGVFQYVSGFFGYMLLGFWFRKFAGTWSAKDALLRVLPLGILGFLLTWLPFYLRIPCEAGYPILNSTYAKAVDMEMSWEFCSLGVALCVFAYFALIRTFARGGGFYARVIRPISQASYGIYLMHMVFLTPIVGCYRVHFSTPVTIVLTAATTFVCASCTSLLLSKIPFVGKWTTGFGK